VTPALNLAPFYHWRFITKTGARSMAEILSLHDAV